MKKHQFIILLIIFFFTLFVYAQIPKDFNDFKSSDSKSKIDNGSKRWFNKESWARLEKGMTDVEVLRLLGKPDYSQSTFIPSRDITKERPDPEDASAMGLKSMKLGDQTTIWFYGPFLIENIESFSKSSLGYLFFVNTAGYAKSTRQGVIPAKQEYPKYILQEWHLPKWEEIQKDLINTEPLIFDDTSIVKSKWHNRKAWGKIKLNMTDDQLLKILGKPTRKNSYHDTKNELFHFITHVWDYKIEGCEEFGQVFLENSGMAKSLIGGSFKYDEPHVVGWTEPFWPRLLLHLKEENDKHRINSHSDPNVIHN